MTWKYRIASGAAFGYNPVAQSILALTHNSTIYFFITQENYMTHFSPLPHSAKYTTIYLHELEGHRGLMSEE